MLCIQTYAPIYKPMLQLFFFFRDNHPHSSLDPKLQGEHKLGGFLIDILLQKKKHWTKL